MKQDIQWNCRCCRYWKLWNGGTLTPYFRFQGTYFGNKPTKLFHSIARFLTTFCTHLINCSIAHPFEFTSHFLPYLVGFIAFESCMHAMLQWMYPEHLDYLHTTRAACKCVIRDISQITGRPIISITIKFSSKWQRRKFVHLSSMIALLYADAC